MGFRREAVKMSYILQTNHLTKKIDGKELVRDVNLHVKKGEIYGFLGPNGAGKTTVMKMITNLWKPTEGAVELFGETLESDSYDVFKRMGSIIEFPTFYEHLSGRDTLDTAPGMDAISAPIELFTGMAFLIFTSVMLASFLVSAYKNKTMNLMFTYPVKRRNILVSQMLAVWIFNFAALVLSKLIIYLCILTGSKYMQPSFAIDFDMGSVSFYIQLILKSFVIVSMSFIALFVGMALKSSKAAIVTSFLLIFLTQANVGDFTMADNAGFPLVLTAVSFGFAALSIYHVEQKDL